MWMQVLAMKINITISIDEAVVEKVRNATFYSPGVSMSSIFELGAEAVVLELEQRNGEPFKQRTGELRAGRLSK